MKKHLFYIVTFLLLVSLSKAQVPTSEFVKACIDSASNAYLNKHKDIAKIDNEVVKIISITPKKAILIEQQKIKNKIEDYKSAWKHKEELAETQNQLKAYRSKDKKFLRDQLWDYKEKFATVDQDINHKCALITRVLYEKSVDSTNVEYKKNSDDSTVLFYLAQVNSKTYYMNGKLENEKFSIVFTLNSIYRKELSFKSHVF